MAKTDVNWNAFLSFLRIYLQLRKSFWEKGKKKNFYS